MLVAPVALAKRHTIDAGTQLSLDFELKGATVCMLHPEALREEEACQGVGVKDAEALRTGGPNILAVGIVRPPEEGIFLTVASVTKPGIGQMHGEDLESFIRGMMSGLSRAYGAPAHTLDEAGKPYSLFKVGDVPVARFAYKAAVPETDPQANRASAVVYLVPSRDTVTLISFNTLPRHMAAAREVGEQLISTLNIPLTVDAQSFGGADPAYELGRALGRFLCPLLLGALVIVWLVRRSRKARGRGSQG